MMAEGVEQQGETSGKDMRLVIGASSLGTMFEWYDFFIYGTLANSGIIGKAFFPADNDVVQTLLVWAGFAVGFGFRPLGAVLFGFLGDRLGRKATFLITITLMGLATAGVGLIPSHERIGLAAPALVIFLRILQGLALGGEYGGAATYVAEHAPHGTSGYYTSYIQASVAGGFVLSLIVVLAFKWSMSDAVWAGWGWRAPFVFSLLLLVVSVWMRFKLSESPVFAKMKASGTRARNPFVESFTYPGNPKRLFVALFGVAAGLTVIWYTATFSVLAFLQGPMRVEETAAQIITGVGALLGMGFFILFGWISDKVGRRRPIVIGYVLTLVLLFPLFWLMGTAANIDLAKAAKAAPVVVSGPNCTYDPFLKEQAETCGRVIDYLSKHGVRFTTGVTPAVSVSIDGEPVQARTKEEFDAALRAHGYNLGKVVPTPGRIALILLAILGLSALSGATYGPVAAALAEMFPPQIRYSSLSIPYHIGTGYFGGFLPLISQYIVAKTGNPYAGLWYTFTVVVLALAVAAWGLWDPKPGKPALD